jgi:hypothetical protein
LKDNKLGQNERKTLTWAKSWALKKAETSKVVRTSQAHISKPLVRVTFTDPYRASICGRQKKEKKKRNKKHLRKQDPLPLDLFQKPYQLSDLAPRKRQKNPNK